MPKKLISATILSLLTNNIRHFNQKVLAKCKDDFTTPTRLYCYLGGQLSLCYLASQWQKLHTEESLAKSIQMYKQLQNYDEISSFDSAEVAADLWVHQPIWVVIVEAAVWAVLNMLLLYFSASSVFEGDLRWYMPAIGLGLFGAFVLLLKHCRLSQEEQSFSTLQRYALARNTVFLILEYEQQTRDLAMEPLELLFVVNYLSDVDFVPFVSSRGCAKESILLEELRQAIATARNTWSASRLLNVSA